MIDEQEILDLLESDWFTSSVSSGDAPISSVSGGDAGNYYQINLYALPELDQETEVQTLWSKPLEDYSVTEGLLLLLDLVVLVVLVWFIVQGGFKWRK